MLSALVLYYGLYISLILWAPIGKVGFSQKDLSHAQIQQFLKVRALQCEADREIGESELMGLKLLFCVQLSYQ